MSINNLFDGLKTLDEIKDEDYTLDRRMNEGLYRYKRKSDDSYIIIEDTKVHSERRYNVITRGRVTKL